MGDYDPGVLSADRPSEAAVQEKLAELEAVLASRMFLRGPSLASILNYVCREVLEGRGEGLKEYNIAVQALGRAADFDPARDSIVRVEVSRLRKRLHQYYAAEGMNHAIQIRFPVAGYAPRFLRQPSPVLDEPSATIELQQARAVQHPPFRRGFWVAGAGLCLLLIYASLWWAAKPAASSKGKASLAPPASNSTVPGTAVGDPLRIAVGSTGFKYVDRQGQIWVGDRFFTGGTLIDRPDRRILRTLDQPLYQKAREGDFQYDIPLTPGVYELHLHFAELIYQESLTSTGEAWRRFHVDLNGKPLLTNFDIVLDAPGPYTADERVFKDVRPAADGFVHLRFRPFINKPILSGIELLPVADGKMRPVRILAGNRNYYDRREQLWGTDRFFHGGGVIMRSVGAKNTADPELFAAERFGNFNYWIPVPEGRYSVALNFSESNFGVDNFGSSTYTGGSGSRLFDVYCNGTALLRNFDILREAGGPNRAVQKVFSGLRPNAQGKLALSFVPVLDYPTIRSIEVRDEGR